MRFTYQARTKIGQVQSGTIEASSREAAFDLLKVRELYVTALEEFHPPFYAREIRLFEQITNKDIVVFSRQMAIMFKARVPLVEIFQTLAKQTTKTRFREVILKISEEVEGGTSLSNALSIFPALFSPFYINMVRSGEAAGKLTDIFQYLAEYLEKGMHFRSRLLGALTYPLFVLFVFVVVMIIVITFVVPEIAKVVAETGQQLPYITRLMLGLANFMATQGLVVALVVFILVLIFLQWKRTEKGKKFFDNAVLRIPIVGLFLQKIFLVRFCLNLSTLIAGGLPIAQALQITADVVNNERYKEIINRIKTDVRKGEKMSSVLEKYPAEITPFVYQMVITGEKTGTLDTSLINVVDFYQQDIDRALDDFAKLLEPIMIIVLGFMVGGLFGAVLIPIYSIAGGS